MQALRGWVVFRLLDLTVKGGRSTKPQKQFNKVSLKPFQRLAGQGRSPCRAPRRAKHLCGKLNAVSLFYEALPRAPQGNFLKKVSLIFQNFRPRSAKLLIKFRSSLFKGLQVKDGVLVAVRRRRNTPAAFLLVPFLCAFGCQRKGTMNNKHI